MSRVLIKIYGQVQDVGFRYYSKIIAEKLDLIVNPKNETDGTVVIEAEGDDNSVNKFIEWCRQGPKYANVDKIEITKV